MHDFCDPISGVCNPVSDFADDANYDEVIRNWGILAWTMVILSSQMSTGNYNLLSTLFNGQLKQLGWALMWSFNTFTWGFVAVTWALRYAVKDNHIIDWLFVFSSNSTMWGPLGVYWASILLIWFGWFAITFDGFSIKSTLYLIEWIALSFTAATLQWVWIEDVRSEYNGKWNTGEEAVDDWHDSTWEVWPDDEETNSADTPNLI